MSLAVNIRNAALVLPDRIVAGPLHVAGRYVAAAATPGAWELDLREHLVFPGLVNAHEHLQLNNIPPLPQHEPFPNSYAWIAAFQPYFRNGAVAAAVAVPAARRYWQGGLKNLLCGATTVAHHDPWHPTLDDPRFPVRLLRHYGWSHSLGLGREGRKPEGRRQKAESQKAEGRRQKAEGSLFSESLDLLPRYGPPVVESFAATPRDVPWIIHLAEGSDEVAAAELAQLDGLGCLGANTVLVHAVGLSTADTQLVIAQRAGVVWCPVSNMRILGRTLEPRRLWQAGRLALGSDSRIAGGYDMLAELRIAAQQSDLTPAELLGLATVGGGRVLAMPAAGGLTPGQHADMLIVADAGGDPYQALLGLQRGDIRAVVRDGLPAIADPDLHMWFAACDIEAVPVLLDGRPKLLAAHLARPEVVELEPGLELNAKR